MDTTTLALILAGGQGSRLGVLTKTVAKPAVLFGSKYRIIDFSLSNCANSGIYNLGIIEQYMPLKLNSHIGIGKPWDMDRMNGGATILTPYLAGEKGDWFKGTADAVYQNIHYIDKVNPDHVVILSGDHIYKMNYSFIIDYHKKKGSDCTISVIDVPIEEASRFGIMNVDEDNKIFEFSEKPENPKSTLASMGVYVFSWQVLRQALIEDHDNIDSSNDFGKDIIPKLLSSNKNLYAFTFDGYWKDVGTLTSYWETNIELTQIMPPLNLFDSNWRIYTPNPVKPAHFISPEGKVTKSMVAEGCMIFGEVKNCILFPGVTVGEGSYIENSVIMSNTTIGKNCKIYKSIISEHCFISDNVQLGIFDSKPNTYRPDLYKDDLTVLGENAVIPADTRIGKNVVIDADIVKEDFKSTTVDSGSAILKEVE